MDSFMFDTSQYFRFPVKELEEDYLKYLSCTLGNAEQTSPIKKDRLSVESTSKESEEGVVHSDKERRTPRSRRNTNSFSGRRRRRTEGDDKIAEVESATKENEKSDNERHTPRSRRNTNSSTGRRRKRTEGDDDILTFNGDAVDALAYDLAIHCKFSGGNEMEAEYQAMLSGATTDNGPAVKTTPPKSVKAPNQRLRDRSNKSSEKNHQRPSPTEEQKVSPTGDENEPEFRNAYRGRGYRGRPRSHYSLTPYQGVRRCFGEFVCRRCYRQWGSAYSRANTAQQCNACGFYVYPHAQWPLMWFTSMDGPWDDLEDQENRYRGHRSPEDNYEYENKLGNSDRRSTGYRPRYPLRPQYRRRREQEF